MAMYNNFYPSNNPYSTTAIPYNNIQPMYNQIPQNNVVGKQQVVRVNGKNGAQTYQMPPNSSILLLDETAPIVWLKTTDGAGYPTLTPYDIAPHQPEQQQIIDTKSLEDRISKLEEIVNEQLVKSDVEVSQPVKRVVTTTAK